MASPTLTGASIEFHTNDDDKNHDTVVEVTVLAGNEIWAAHIKDRFGHFGDHSDTGPFDLVVLGPITRDQLKTGSVFIQIFIPDEDTWRFNFFLDLRFSDGSHLIARANRLQMGTHEHSDVRFGIE
jgi:hypothetical protein